MDVVKNPPTTIDDAELCRRLGGHLQEPLRNFLPLGISRPHRRALGVFWALVAIAGLVTLWYALLYLPIWLLSNVITGGFQTIAGTGDLPFGTFRDFRDTVMSIVFMGSLCACLWYGFVTAWNRRRDRQGATGTGEAGPDMNAWFWRHLVHVLLIYLPALSLSCLFDDPEPEGSLQHAYARLCLVLADHPEPANLEQVQKRLLKRFSKDSWQSPETELVRTVGLLRDLKAARLITDEHMGMVQGDISDRTIFSATETLRALVKRARLVPRDVFSESPANQPPPPKKEGTDSNQP
jgi:hypothetical protein